MLLSEDLFYLYTNSVDPDEMQHNKCSIMLHFIWVFTVCKSTRLGVCRIQRIKIKLSFPGFEFLSEINSFPPQYLVGGILSRAVLVACTSSFSPQAFSDKVRY